MNKMSAAISTSAIKSFLATVTVVSCLAMSAGQLTAASSTNGGSGPAVGEAARAAQPLVTETILNADDSSEVFARASAARAALGFPPGSKSAGRHVHDGLQNSDYDEVTEVDAAGQTIAMAQFDAAGRLLAALRFDSPSGSAPAVTGDAAAKTAQRGLAASGVAVSGQARVDLNPTAGGWDVHWERSQDGFAVRGDETRVHVWQDGRIQSVARVEHPLAAAPTRRLGQADAQQAVIRQVDKWFAGKDYGYAVGGLDLEWVGPNAAFDSSKVGTAPAPYRLAWVANVKPSGSASTYVQLITLYVDAGDGTVIGGDIVE